MTQTNNIAYDHIVVRYGELTTKGKNRSDFTKKLVMNMKKALRDVKGLVYERTHDRLYIILNGHDAHQIGDILRGVFGISSFSYAVKIENDLEEIIAYSFQLLTQEEGHTFKVVTKRGNKQFPHHSDEINRSVATKILQDTNWKVDVHNPDIYLRIEIRNNNTYIMANKIVGAGGYPVGVGGKGMLMLSGGIDSPVAGYLTQKRGISMECIHYASPPYTSQAAQDKVLDLARKLATYQGHVRVHVVPFTELQLAIYKHCDESYAITIMRRMMYRLADRLCAMQKASVIVNGESIGQVASQTLQSMVTINAVTSRPVIRPVATLDKLEIIDIAKRIDTYETSILPFEDCCTIFTPKSPVTKPQLDKAEHYEQNFDFETLLETCLNNIETIDVYPTKDTTEMEEFF